MVNSLTKASLYELISLMFVQVQSTIYKKEKEAYYNYQYS